MNGAATVSSGYRLAIGPFHALSDGASFSSVGQAPEHVHAEDQLLYPGTGLVTVTTRQGAWVVPPERAVWIPAKTAHSVTAVRSSDNRSVFFQPRLAVRSSKQCEVIGVGQLLHELILETYRAEASGAKPERMALMLAFLIDQVREAEALPLSLPHPRHPQLARLCEAFLNDPVAHATIDDWSGRMHMSRRTFTRLFRHELGMSFADWRQQACLFAALPWLAAGRSVTSVAFDLGYSSTSAFTTMFKRVMGRSPTQYFE